MKRNISVIEIDIDEKQSMNQDQSAERQINKISAPGLKLLLVTK